MKTVVIVGGGPAGMMAAITARAEGADVLLIEKNKRVGKKLGITGKGRGNITAMVDKSEFIASFPGNGKFLFSAFSEFFNRDLIEFFETRGLMSIVDRGQRVFPETERALDVVNLLYQSMVKDGVKINFNQAVKRVLFNSRQATGVEADGKTISAAAVIIATGGLSYPATGSSGDGYRWAEEAGHKIISTRPALVPLEAREEWVKALQGLSLKNVKVIAIGFDGNVIAEKFGEMIFTHFGVSGPIILSMSRDIGQLISDYQQPLKIYLDLKPALSEEKLDERIQRDFIKYFRREFKNSLGELLPQKIIPIIISLTEINAGKKCNEISKRERRTLVRVLKRLPITITGTRAIEEAIVTAGGVDVKEVNPKTMESKLIERLYFAGEILDIDGYTGGYNLQAAFSTGYIAGKYAARSITRSNGDAGSTF